MNGFLHPLLPDEKNIEIRRDLCVYNSCLFLIYIFGISLQCEIWLMEIPSAIILDILSRLPTKTCLNCKLVCKDWYQIIISNEFADLRSSHCSYLTILLHGKFYSGRYDFLLFDLDRSSIVNEMGNLNVSVDAMIRFKSKLTIPHHKLAVINECDGLVCFKSSEQWSPYIICNLLTGQQVLVKQFRKPSCSVEFYGLGCCPVSHQFKVLRILKFNLSYLCVAEIQTLGTNEWRTIGDSPVNDQLDMSGVFLNGSLHKYSYTDNCIWSFDFGIEQFWQVPTPDEMKREYYKGVSVFYSCLCFTSFYENGQFEIWLMREYGMKDSWVKQFVIHLEYYDSPRIPLLQMGTGEILGCRIAHESLGACDIESGSWRSVMIRGQSSFKNEELNLIRSLSEDIPSSIIWEILLRLPIKACLNCKLVCKEWYQIIISYEFANFRSSHCSYSTILLYGKIYNKKKNFLMLDLDKSSKVDEMGNLSVDVNALIRFKSRFNTSHDKLYVVNECNGVVCLKSWEQWSPYIICNLLTGQQVIVEQLPKSCCSVEVYGLGCCPVSHQYKVLRILKTKGTDNCVAEIQTLGTHEWRTIGDAPQFQLRRSGAFLHGSLHRYSYRDNCIWSFQFGNEQFSHVPIPDDMKREPYTEVSVFHSRLCFSSISESCRQCEIWLMKEYGVKESWVKQFVFQIESFAHRMPLLQLGTEVLVSYSNSVRLGACDTESGRCKTVRVPGVSLSQVMVCNAKFSKF
ncbi:hypothetical protein RDABS01_012451 [Bienertia sinuspersici]